MSAQKNKVQLIGHVGGKPETKMFEGNRKMAKIAVATNECYVNAKGEKIIDTQWHPVVAWGKLAETAEKLFIKGSPVMVEGKLVTRHYDDKEGIRRYLTEVHAYDIYLLSKRNAKPDAVEDPRN